MAAIAGKAEHSPLFVVAHTEEIGPREDGGRVIHSH